MDKYMPQERAETVAMFIENNRSIFATQRKLPHKTTIYRLHANFQQYGTTADRPRSGRQGTSRNAGNVALVRDNVSESLETSIRRRGSQLHISAILRLSGEVEDFSSKLIMSDEAHFFAVVASIKRTVSFREHRILN
ncbi:hypothetical protein GWI33_002436 [Rhynchophorus ferrugineus]|uniref:DUF4817 domain-containing protein n=1 Tax=Rhynchophorus ferrugineus TaxID=354439 RepID=A0A834MPA7_RHYFE|nr:hypothetical protein GWI33_002436 [Rhynchophorus ferrugineus]